MNQLVKAAPAQAQAPSLLEMTAQEQITVLRSSIYPGATDASIKMVLDYCRASGLNPMLKPVHIVPMSVKKPGGNRNDYEWRDVLMPSIGHYRTQASRSGAYLGKSEPIFGPTVTEDVGGKRVSYPEWCTVTVKRMIGQHIAEFTATEYWLENYATAAKDSSAPNAMWTKRPRGQLAKCAEAQALRMAFPELTGDAPTAEEMEGKLPVIEGQALPVAEQKPAALPKAAQQASRRTERLDSFAGKPKASQQAAQARREPDPEPHGEIVDEDTGEVIVGVPVMPADAAELWSGGKFMKAWQWFERTLPTLPEDKRQIFADEHEELLAKVAGYAPKYAEAVDALANKCGVALNAA